MTPSERRVGRVTTKGPAEERMRSADEGLLQRQEDPGFVHTDPWRVLRIMGEFVDGFDVLARVGLAVTVFGSARVKADSPYYAAAREVGHGLAERGFAVITGGGPGIMEAANRGAQRGRRPLDRLQHRAAARAGAEPLREPLDRLPLLLRAQDDVRQVLGGVRRLPRRLRHARRAVRGADADPDRQGQALPGRALRLGVLERPARLDARARCSPRAWSRTSTSRSCRSSTRPRRCARSPPAARRGERRARAALPARGRSVGRGHRRRAGGVPRDGAARRRDRDLRLPRRARAARRSSRATLQGLRDRGVRVRILDHDEREATREVPDNVPRPAAPPEYIDALGLDVRPVIGFGTLMHHKYVVIDGERVWTGSMNWTEDSFTLQENCIVTLDSPDGRGRLPARLRGALEPPEAPRQERPLRRDVVGRDLRRAARARAAVLLPRPRARARRADRQPHRVRARAHPDLLARAHVRADPRARCPTSSGAASCPSRASSTARRCTTSCASGAGCRRPRGSPRRSASSPRRRASAASAASRGGRTPCTTSCTRSSSCATTGPSPAPTTTRARARRTPRTCSRSTARPCADRVRRGDPRVRRALRARARRRLGPPPRRSA